MAARIAGIENLIDRKLEPKKGETFRVNVEGQMVLLLLSPRVAVVDMRNPMPGGLERAGLFTERLVRNGVVIVGRLARGIDAAAHRTAIRVDGKTVVVLGMPLDESYPSGERRPLGGS